MGALHPLLTPAPPRVFSGAKCACEWPSLSRSSRRLGFFGWRSFDSAALRSGFRRAARTPHRRLNFGRRLALAKRSFAALRISAAGSRSQKRLAHAFQPPQIAPHRRLIRIAYATQHSRAGLKYVAPSELFAGARAKRAKCGKRLLCWLGRRTAGFRWGMPFPSLAAGDSGE